ncbi:MAG: hypothetical protein ACI9GW_002034 [Halieaceae bacterium]|jgi:hypothetical protein
MQKKPHIPWYDSPWLSAYLQARDIVKSVSAETLEEFEQTLSVFRTRPDFQVCQPKQVLDAEVIEQLKQLIKNLDPTTLEKHELLQFGRMVVHNHPGINIIQARLADKVSELVGEEVEPSYSFLSLYNNLGKCEVHMDAPDAKWTLDMCIEQSALWPIHISQIQPWVEDTDWVEPDWHQQITSDPTNKFEEFVLQENSAIVFAGSSQWHYRDRIPRVQKDNFCHLLFLHYIPKGTKELSKPKNWSRIFNVPELNTLEYPLE